MRSAGLLTVGVLAGLVIAVSVLALPRAFGQSLAGPMSSMMGQVMGRR